MKILFLSTHLDTGGITSYILSLSKALKDRGHTVFVASSGGNRVTRFTEQGIIFIRIPIRTKSEIDLFKLIPSARILSTRVKEHQIDIIHANTRVTQVLAHSVSRSTGVPFVSTFHGFFPGARFFRKLFPCLGCRVIAISGSVREHLKQDFKVPEERIRLVYSGVDTEGLRLDAPKSRQTVRTSFGLDPSGPVIGIVARLSEVKGQPFLIRAFASVLKRVPEAQLMIVGEGKTEDSLRRLTAELGLKERVHFLPSVNNVREAYYAMDIFVMPSLNEGLGLGLMEAMAWGKPVVGSAVGGILNLIRDGENGILARPGDPDSLASGILRLIDAPDLAATLGNNARKFISDNFSLEKMAAQTEGVYEECLKPA
ncbi:MAG: glycosyltransferase family 4 protein [Deltaproteobacteria bacterium]